MKTIVNIINRKDINQSEEITMEYFFFLGGGENK